MELPLFQGWSITDFRLFIFSHTGLERLPVQGRNLCLLKELFSIKSCSFFQLKMNFGLWRSFGLDDPADSGFLQDPVHEWTPAGHTKSLTPNQPFGHCYSFLRSRSDHICWGLKSQWPLLVGSSCSSLFLTCWVCCIFFFVKGNLEVTSSEVLQGIWWPEPFFIGLPFAVSKPRVSPMGLGRAYRGTLRVQ